MTRRMIVAVLFSLVALAAESARAQEPTKVYGEWRIRIRPDKGAEYTQLIARKGLPLFREAGGRMSVRSTIEGTPLDSSVETSASPTPSWVIASKQSNSGLGRKVSAATFTAFCSRGV